MSTAEIESLARQLRPNGSDHLLRQGVVTVANASGTCSVNWGNAPDASPEQRCLRSYVALVGDSVWGLRDNDDTLVLGPVDPPPRHVIGAAGKAPYENNWGNYGGGYLQASYTRDAGGFIHLSGMVTGGTMPGTIFTLPVGFRPPGHAYFPIYSTSALNMLQVQAGGAVAVQTTAGGNTWVSLEGITFPTF